MSNHIIRFVRPFEVQQRFHDDILFNQQTDINGQISDTILVCKGGNIRTHSFLLQAASPFLGLALTSQGVDYPFLREILIPDFCVKLMEQVVGLIYKGFAEMHDEVEVHLFTEALCFFQISSVSDCTSTRHRVAQKIVNECYNTASKERVLLPINTDQEQVKRRSRERDSSDQDDACSTCDVLGDRSERSASIPEDPVITVPLPKNLVEAELESKASCLPCAPQVSTAVLTEDNSNNSDSSSEFENIEWIPPNYSDMNWFDKSSRTCPMCKTIYNRAPDASLCLASHGKVRCYFCFEFFDTTESLHLHFQSYHKSACRTGSLICPFCDKPISCRTVSSHVICNHLENVGQHANHHKKTLNASTPESFTPTNCEEEASKTSKKKKKIIPCNFKDQTNGSLKIPALNVTINKRTLFGHKLCFKLQKLRSS